MAAVVLLGNIHRVDEAEVDDVDGDLGIKDLAQLRPHGLGVGRAVRKCAALDGLVLHRLADGVGVLAVETVQAGVSLDGVTAAEDLVDEDLGAGEQRVLVAGGDLRGGDFAAEDAFAVIAHKFLQELTEGTEGEQGLRSRCCLL